MSRLRPSVAAALFALSWLAVGTAPAARQNAPGKQAAPQPVPRFQTGIDLVTLDVTVLDANRRPARGLTAEDFVVLEDGTPQAIQAFTAIDIPDVEESPAVWENEIAPDVRRNDDLADRRILVIVLDDALEKPVGKGQPPSIQATRQLADAFVNRMGPRDLAAVVFPFDKAGGQDFTSDKALLHKAIARYNGGMPARLGPSPEAATNADMPGEPGGSVAFHQRFVYESLANTLKSLAEYLGELPYHRKGLLLVSEGIPMNLADIGIRQGMSDGNDSGGSLRNVYLIIRDMLAAAQRSNVTLYPVDPAGLWFFNDPTKQDFLEILANNTGGFTIVNTNDAAPGLEQVFRENSSYYLIGYVPSNTRTEGRLRKLEVRVKTPGLTVRTRSGYFEPQKAKPAKAGAVPPARPAALWTALGALLPKGDVAMQMWAAPFADPAFRETAVAVVVAVRQPTPAGSARVVDDVDLAVDAFDPGGNRRASRRLKAQVVVRYGKGTTVGYELVTRLDLKPGRYQLRAAAQSSLAGKAGSIYYDIEVPDLRKGAVSMSGLLVHAAAGVPVAPKDGLAPLVPLAPTTVREFDAGSENVVTVFARIYQGGKQPPAPVGVAASIVDGAGEVVFDRATAVGAEQFGAARAADYRVNLPLDRLSPGPHRLTLTATLGRESARRDLRFTVR
jgi:VWFA-related protein